VEDFMDQDGNTLSLGAGKVDVTPPAGLLMAGYGGRDTPAKGTHRPLWARASVCRSGDTSVALAVVDVVGFSRDSTHAIREAVTDRCGIPGDRVMIATTHTHSGPVTTRFRDVVPDTGYMETVKQGIVDAVDQASGAAEPVEVGFGRMRAPYWHHNRRNADLPVDSTLAVARFRNTEGDTVASWVNYGSHPTILTGKNLYWSTDWPGVLCEELESAWGGTTSFYNGCHGDVGPHRPVQDYSEVDRVGKGVACLALQVGEGLCYTPSGTVGSVSSMCSVPLAEAPNEETLRAMLTDTEGARYGPAWAADQLKSREAGEPAATETEVEVQGFRIGDLDLACFPGQLFGDWGVDLRARWPHERLMIVNQANDHAGYFPTEAGWERGGYEANSAFMFNSDLPAPMTWEAGTRMLEEAKRQISAMPSAG
jgi:neutral ceramidase